MLQLFTRLKLVESRCQLRFLANVVTAAKGCQRRIRQRESLSDEFLMDPDEIALAVGPLLQNLLAEGIRFLGPVQ